MAREIAERTDVIPVLGEIFREFGYAGASLSEITRRSGLGKSSLYHFFPGGKKEMATAVLNDIADWFEMNIYKKLREGDDPHASIRSMFESVDQYFQSGNRICLVGAFALDDTRDEFAKEVSTYFTAWIDSLTQALKRTGLTASDARGSAEDTIAGIQGALVLARSRDGSAVFTRTLTRLQRRLSDY